jgi:mono/diheme cytochrome c family protein
MRGRWGEVQDRVTLGFVVAGAWLFALVPIYNLLLALRTSSAVVQFTGWIPGFEVIAWYGAFSMWIFAFGYHALSGGRGPKRSNVAIWHRRLSLTGVFLIVLAMTLGGLVAGFTWIAGANAGEPTSFGSGWEVVADLLAPYLGVRAVGFVVFAFAQVLFAVAAFGAAADPVAEEWSTPIDSELEVRFEDAARTPSWRGLRYGVVFLFLGAFTMTLVLPSLDPEVRAGTILGDETRVYAEGSAIAAGREVYVREGCVACHTQEVRGIVTDVGLGAVSVSGDYVHENPIQRGSERLGPDLMHVAARDENGSAEYVRGLLVDPRAVQPWSVMPSYSYLADEDLDALAQYIVSLR